MHRPPTACRRAAHSLNSLTPAAQPHIWISDELLARTVNRFFRNACGHQKRHGSHVPGPMEARKRATKRQMTMQTNIPQLDIGLPRFDLRALFSKKQSPESSWRYEPPSNLPPRPSPPVSLNARDSSHTTSNDAGPGRLKSATADIPRTQSHTIENRHLVLKSPAGVIGYECHDAGGDVLPSFSSLLSQAPAEDHRPLATTLPESHDAGREFYDLLEVEIGATENITRSDATAGTGTNVKTERRSQIQTEAQACMADTPAVLEKLRALEKKIPRTNDIDVLGPYLDTWLTTASALDHENRLLALKTLCKTGYRRRGYKLTTDEDDIKAVHMVPPFEEYKAAIFLTLEIFEKLTAHDWTLDSILCWLNQPYVLLPADLEEPACIVQVHRFLNLLEVLFEKHNERLRNLDFLETRITSPLTYYDWSDARLAKTVVRINAMVYRAKLGSLAHLRGPRMSASGAQVLSELVDLIILSRTKDFKGTSGIHDRIVDCLVRLRQAEPENLSRFWRIHLFPLFPGQLKPGQLKTIARDILLGHDPVRVALQSKSKSKTKSKSRDSSSEDGAMLLEQLAAEGQQRQTLVKDTQSDIDQKLTVSTTSAPYWGTLGTPVTPAGSFHNILLVAQDAHVLPLCWRGESLQKLLPELYPRRAPILNQLAYQYSIENTRRLQQNQRSITRIYRHMKRSRLTIGNMVSESLVRIFITRPMAENAFVSAKRTLWVLQIVESAEGPEVAQKVWKVFREWKGEIIQAAQRKNHELGISGPARIGQFKRLGISIGSEEDNR